MRVGKDLADKSITYLGRKFVTSISKPLTDEEYKEAVDYIMQVPDFKDVEKELKALYNGKTKISNITGYYFLHLMYEARNGQDAWSIKEALSYKPIMEYFNGKCAVNEKVFPKSQPLGERFKTAFRLCGIRCARKLPQFPIKTIDELLSLYTKEGDNYYDFSCGWGARMLSTIKNNRNYFGTDPNYKLINKIKECHTDYNRINNTNTFIDIRPQGSEIFVEEWENKMNFIFSSPPYFNLEIYKNGKQSCDENTNYSDWLNDWMKPTVNNIYKYLKDDGVFAINIKDIIMNKTKYSLEKDTIDIITASGFELIDVKELKNIKRTFGSVHWEKHTAGVSDKADEHIFVFKKK